MLKIVESLLWSLAIILLLGGGIFYTFKLKLIHFNFIKIISAFKNNKKDKISPIKGLFLSLAARIGVGSIAGIALAIYKGGPGTIFWIWISSLLTSSDLFVETLLGIKFREKDGDVYKGGPSYYIDKGLNNKRLAKLYAFIIIAAYIIGFMTIQANTITKSIIKYISVSPITIGMIISFFTFLCIYKGFKSVSNVTNILVPIMSTIYLFISIYILILNINKIPNILKLIFNSALNIKTFKYGVISSFIIGIQRGLFSTEAGLGSSSIASSTTDDNNGVKIGLIQVVGIYFTIFIICTSTAFIILTSDFKDSIYENINGVELIQYALNYHLGNIGSLFLIFSIIAFAFSTIISGYYYGESNLKYLINKNYKKHIFILKIVTLLLLIVGSVSNPSILWKIVDIFVSLMAIINMYAIIKLRKVVKEELYKQNKKNLI